MGTVLAPLPSPLMQAEFYTGHRTGDLAGNKGLSSTRAFMVEKNAVACIDTIGLTIVHRNPVCVEFCNTIRASWIKRSGLLLGNLLHKAKQFRRACLIKVVYPICIKQ